MSRTHPLLLPADKVQFPQSPTSNQFPQPNTTAFSLGFISLCHSLESRAHSVFSFSQEPHPAHLLFNSWKQLLCPVFVDCHGFSGMIGPDSHALPLHCSSIFVYCLFPFFLSFCIDYYFLKERN